MKCLLIEIIALGCLLSLSSAQFTNNAEADDIRFILYTSSSDSGTVVSSSNIESSNFDDGRDTKILIHSWMPNGQDASWWITDFQQTLFQANSNINCIVVNWVDGNDMNYFQSAANAAFVAQQTGAFLSAVQSSSKGLTASKIHIFGHGIGAHIAGIMKSSFSGVGKITAFDPVGRSFDDEDDDDRLDKDDADFVDCIHTDDDGMGTSREVGDVDIFFHGGNDQPGATGESDLLEALLSVGGDGAISGSHFRGIELYEEAIEESGTTYNVYSADSYDVFIQGNSFGGTTARFGPSIDSTATGKFYGASLSSSPYLTNNYYTILITTTTSRLGADVSLIVDGLPNGVSRTVSLESEGGLATAASAGNYRSVIVLPTGMTANDFTYKVSYTVDSDATLVAADSQVISGVTLRQGDSTTYYGNCAGLTVAAGASVDVTLAEGTNCGLGDAVTQALTTTLIVLAATSAGAAGAVAIAKLKKLISKIKMTPVTMVKIVPILTGGITALKALKLLQIKKVLTIGKIMKSLSKGPFLFGLMLIMKGSAAFGLKILKMKEYVKDIAGLNPGDLLLRNKIVELLSAADNDSLLEKIIDNIIGKLTLNIL